MEAEAFGVYIRIALLIALLCYWHFRFLPRDLKFVEGGSSLS
jgi:hypothetical protein